MRIRKDFILRQIAGQWVILPLAGNSADFSGMVKLNEAGVMLWKLLEKGCSLDALVDALVAEYQISRELAAADAERFLEKLSGIGCIEQE